MFRSPIEYVPPSSLHRVAASLLDDLEYTETNSETRPALNHHQQQQQEEQPQQRKTTPSVMQSLLSPTCADMYAPQKHRDALFTSHVPFLKDTQTLLSKLGTTQPQTKTRQHDWQRVDALYAELDQDHFLDTYDYIDWEPLLFLNESESALQTLSMCQLMSPVSAMIMPLFLLALPLFLLRLKGIPIALDTYLEHLHTIGRHHVLGQLAAMSLHQVSWESLLYFVGMVVLYVMQMYHNVHTCIRMYTNVRFINDELRFFHEFLSSRLAAGDAFLQQAHRLQEKTYHLFVHDAQPRLDQLRVYLAYLFVPCFDLCSLDSYGTFGDHFQRFYDLHRNEEFRATLAYVRALDHYLAQLEGIAQHLHQGLLAPATFGETTVLRQQRYYLQGQKQEEKQEQKEKQEQNETKQQANDCDLSKSIVLTGVNASGKTTYLKSTAINVLLSQQYGCGFYAHGSTLRPYTHLHCYLNIPDTNGRDSLFQAEARRCREILGFVEGSEKNQHHLCFLDELFSGTNPYEAVAAATSLLRYLAQNDKVTFLLTTHYTRLCTKLKKYVQNKKMMVTRDAETHALRYSYRVCDGVCHIRGALDVLQALDYPAAILDDLANEETQKTKNTKKTKTKKTKEEKTLAKQEQVSEQVGEQVLEQK